jgi:hypothetical protein
MNAADPKVAQALQQASMVELFALSTLIDRLMADPARIAQIRLRLHLGQAVRFADWRDPQMPMRAAKVVALAKDHVSVLEDGANRQWNRPYAAVEPPTGAASPAQAASHAATPPPHNAASRAQRGDFRSGDKVVFEDRLLQTQFGTIVRINRQTATVHTDDGKAWRVSFPLLRRIVDV